MLVRNFIPGHQKLGNAKDTEGGNFGCLIFVGGAIILAVIGIKTYDFFKKEAPPSLFAEVPGLVISTSVEEMENISRRELPLPSETFGSKIQAIGFYPHKSKSLPAASMSIVFARDGWRFVEILERPGLTLTEALKAFPEPHQPIRLNQTDGFLVSVGHGEPKCSLAEDGYLGVCEIRRVLLFETETAVISIAADGTSVTDGELIEMARSIGGGEILNIKDGLENKEVIEPNIKESIPDNEIIKESTSDKKEEIIDSENID